MNTKLKRDLAGMRQSKQVIKQRTLVLRNILDEATCLCLVRAVAPE